MFLLCSSPARVLTSPARRSYNGGGLKIFAGGIAMQRRPFFAFAGPAFAGFVA